MMQHHLSFPIPSWADLPHICDSSAWIPFYFREYRNYFCLLLALATSPSVIFPIPGTFHPKRWSLSSARCPASNHFTLNSDPLNLALTWKSEACLRQNALSCPL